MYADSCSEEEVRLVGPSSGFAGRVELCVGSIWTTVCDDFWDNRDASVLCRQLGYSPYGLLHRPVCLFVCLHSLVSCLTQSSHALLQVGDSPRPMA